jgi:hypothetical protein
MKSIADPHKPDADPQHWQYLGKLVSDNFGLAVPWQGCRFRPVRPRLGRPSRHTLRCSARTPRSPDHITGDQSEPDHSAGNSLIIQQAMA